SFTESQPASSSAVASASWMTPGYLSVEVMRSPEVPDSRVVVICMPSEPHPHAHAIGASQDVVVLRAGTGDATARERRALVEQVGHRAEDLQRLQLADLQPVGPAEAEVQVRVDPVVVDTAQQEIAAGILVVRAAGAVAPVLV